MPEYNNAAGYLLDTLERLLTKNRRDLKLAEFAEQLGVSADWRSVLVAVLDLESNFNDMLADVEQLKENSAKYDNFKRNFPAIEKSVKSFSLDIPTGHASWNVSDSSVVALRFIAADLPQEQAAEKDDLEQIRTLVSELQTQIEQTTTFSKKTREWLLDLVRTIRDSIDRYACRGSRGMREQCALLIGELMLNYGHVTETAEKNPNLWRKLTSTIDFMVKVASLGEKLKPALALAQKSLPLLESIGMANPLDRTPNIE
ncbi:hypothetical protein [Allorhodopirellula heiligendammensis]|uniref:Uncharacterized protein n=1 Tax=Allorhodopirellula heiligendammensis TaxID=2714739 RepID=A0A5C6C6A0_9BACT|nr:hypothetical protein [Allorhodopirellula heiligendammensis]TWU19572.1 hypothetical protein Poly21_17460 [Allorhodopirellula heiligendammensis]